MSEEKESGNKHANRFHSPPVELPSSNAQNFFEEAKITNVEESELRRKFSKFCTKAKLAHNAKFEERSYKVCGNSVK